MKSLAICCPSTGGHEEAVTSWQDTMSKPHEIIVLPDTEGDQAGFLMKCQMFKLMLDNNPAGPPDVIAYLHSDLFMHEKDWDRRVLAEFDDERVAVVGVVGATGLAHEDIFKIPYHYTQLARCGVYSNLTDAEVHGERFTGERDVAVLDSCAIFVRSELLHRIGGWPVGRYPNSSHCSDLWISCMAHRHQERVRLVGISCTHRSGGRGATGEEWLNARGGDHKLHQQAHVALYEDFRDVLPVRIR